MNNSEKLINKFLDYIKNIRLFSNHTYRSYKYDLNDYIDYCDNYLNKKNFIKLDQTAIQAYLQHLSRNGLSAKTLARRLASIKSLYNYMIEKKIIKINYANSIKTPKIKKELPQYLSYKQVIEMLNLPLGNSEKAIRERLILALFYATGIRISELVSIRYKNINLNEGIINIIGKGEKERIVIIGTFAQDLIKSYQKIFSNQDSLQSNTYLFPAIRNKNKIEKNISTKTVYNIVKKYMKKISNDEKLSPHSLRHTFATHMLNNGADLMAIKDLLGHSSLSSTQIYTHLQPEKLKQIYKQAHPLGK